MPLGHEQADTQHVQQPEQPSQLPKQLIITNQTLNTHAFGKALGWARSNGDDLKFKADAEGVLSLA